MAKALGFIPGSRLWSQNTNNRFDVEPKTPNLTDRSVSLMQSFENLVRKRVKINEITTFAMF